MLERVRMRQWAYREDVYKALEEFWKVHEQLPYSKRFTNALVWACVDTVSSKQDEFFDRKISNKEALWWIEMQSATLRDHFLSEKEESSG